MKKFRRCSRGGVLILFGILAPIMFGFVGLSVDYGSWLEQRTHMQSAADAAALAGARVYSDTGDGSASDNQANSVLSAHNATGGTHAVGLTDGDTAYQVVLQQQGNSYFAGLFPTGPASIGVRAKAAIITGPGPCVLALDTSSSNALWLDSNAQITATGCKVQSNSSSGQGLNAESNSQVTAEAICVAGGYGGGDSHYNPTPGTCPPASDPLAGIAVPSFGGCDYNNYILDGATATLNPGVYCGGLHLDSSAVATFNPGIYIIKDGKLWVDSNSTAQGAGVVFYLTGTNATIEFDSNSAIDFTAPTTGPLAGIIFFEDRNAPLNQEHYFDSNNISRLEGAVYLSRGLLWIDSNSQISSGAAFTTIVAHRIRVDSNAQLVLNSNYADSDVPALLGTSGGTIRLLE